MATESIRMAGASQLSLNSLAKRAEAAPEAQTPVRAGADTSGRANAAATDARAQPSTTVTISPRARELAAARNEDDNNRAQTQRTEAARTQESVTVQQTALLNAQLRQAYGAPA